MRRYRPQQPRASRPAARRWQVTVGERTDRRDRRRRRRGPVGPGNRAAERGGDPPAVPPPLTRWSDRRPNPTPVQVPGTLPRNLHPPGTGAAACARNWDPSQVRAPTAALGPPRSQGPGTPPRNVCVGRAGCGTDGVA
ncbi:hypothetical protein FTX61_05080 [Nitriliruptoraceae bacterium ZYF776]|nr:hypothetical protein [Profundirhabdus halotolerans]